MTPRLFIVPHEAQWAIQAAVAVSILWKGGWRERLVGLVFLAPTLLYLAFPVHGQESWRLVNGCRSLADDLALLAACLISARRAGRYWVIWAGAFALLGVATDLVFLSMPRVTMMAFWSADLIWSWGVACAVIWGSLANRHRPPSSVTT
jgi:hypothetical protein